MILFIMRVNVKALAFAKGFVNDTWKSSVAAKFISVCTPDCDLDDSLMVWYVQSSWQVYILSERARFCVNVFQIV